MDGQSSSLSGGKTAHNIIKVLERDGRGNLFQRLFPHKLMSVKLGVVADTHNYVDPVLFEIFMGAQAILHAGDIESMEVLEQLERIAPVYAVAGNRDPEQLKNVLPWIRAVEFGGIKIALTHQVLPINFPSILPTKKNWTEEFGVNGARALVFGHTHEPANRWIGNLLYFNPGFAGPVGEEPLRTAGLLFIEGEKIRGEIYHLSEPPSELLLGRAKRWK